jgi:uncharacterized integral membrane protein
MTNIGNPDVETARMKYAFWLAIIGLLLAAVLAMFLMSEANMQNVQSTDIVGIVGLFTSVLGTLVGAFFGLQIGAAGAHQERKSRENAEEDRRQAETLAHMAMAHLSPDDANRVMAMAKRPG